MLQIKNIGGGGVEGGEEGLQHIIAETEKYTYLQLSQNSLFVF